MASSRCPYGPGAGAAAAGLDAEQVVQQRDDEVVVQVRVRRGRMRKEMIGQPPGLAGCRGSRSAGWPAQRRSTACQSCSSLAWIRSVPTRLLEREHQPGPDRLDDGRGAALLAGDRVVEVAVADGVDERHGAAARAPWARRCGPARGGPRGRRGSAGRRGTCAGTGKPRPCDPPPRARMRPRGSAGRARPRRSPRTTARRARAAAGPPRGVGQDAGHVRGGGETADQQRPVSEPGELRGPGRQRRCGRRRPRR